MFILYDLIFLLIAIIYLPIYLFRGKFHSGFLLRLGFLPKGLTLDRPIWIHAVSVGEAMVVKGILRGFRDAFPGKKFVISTVTPTGNKIAKSIAKAGDLVTYLPLDLSFITRSVIKRINPSLFIAAETEIWPNLISALYKRSIPVIIVNGRISDNSFKGYAAIKFLMQPVFSKISLFCVQTQRDAQRLMRLGISQNKIQVTGNMKFDIQVDAQAKKDYADYRLKLGLSPEDKFFVAGSTHAGEEEVVLAVYKQLHRDFPELKLLLAPRHPQKSNEVARIVSRFGFRPIFVSTLPFTCSTCMTTPVFILDTVGSLISFYGLGDIVFVGGSLVKKGGHNILEPAALARPILFGPYMFNFRDIADLFLKNKAAILAHNPEELQESLRHLLTDSSDRAKLGQAAKELVANNQGATGRTLECIMNFNNRTL